MVVLCLFLLTHIMPSTNQLFDFTTIGFTVTAWIWIPSNFSDDPYDYFILFSHCQKTVSDSCLHLAVGNGYLRLNFFWFNTIHPTDKF